MVIKNLESKNTFKELHTTFACYQNHSDSGLGLVCQGRYYLVIFSLVFSSQVKSSLLFIDGSNLSSQQKGKGVVLELSKLTKREASLVSQKALITLLLSQPKNCKRQKGKNFPLILFTLYTLQSLHSFNQSCIPNRSLPQRRHPHQFCARNEMNKQATTDSKAFLQSNQQLAKIIVNPQSKIANFGLNKQGKQINMG